MRGGGGSNSAMKWEFLKLTMPALLAPHVDGPVVEMTDLRGSDYFAAENHRPVEGDRLSGLRGRIGNPPQADSLPHNGWQARLQRYLNAKGGGKTPTGN
jgi:hypothetical protein